MVVQLTQALINEGALVLWHDYRSKSLYDFSGNGNHGVGTDVFWSNCGLEFTASGSSIVTVSDSSELRITAGAVVCLGNYKQQLSQPLDFISQGTQWYCYTSTTPRIFFRDSVATSRNIFLDITNNSFIGINFADTEIPEVFVDPGVSAGLMNGTVSISTGAGDIKIGRASALGTKFDETMCVMMLVNRKLTSTEYPQLYGELSAMHWPSKQFATISAGENSAAQWKTDWGVNESIAGVTSGYLENSPFRVSSGTFSVIVDTLNGKIIKSIECDSAGNLEFPDPDGYAGDWTGWLDTGGGYSEGTLSVAGGVLSMSTGNKLAYSAIDGSYAIRKEIT